MSFFWEPNRPFFVPIFDFPKDEIAIDSDILQPHTPEGVAVQPVKAGVVSIMSCFGQHYWGTNEDTIVAKMKEVFGSKKVDYAESSSASSSLPGAFALSGFLALFLLGLVF